MPKLKQALLTGATVTDEEIRAFREGIPWKNNEELHTVIAISLSTSKWQNYDANKRETARERIAGLINKKHKRGTK